MVMLAMNFETAELQFTLGERPCSACPGTAYDVVSVGILGAEPPYSISSTDVIICPSCESQSRAEPVAHATLADALVRLPEPTAPGELNGADLAAQVLGDIAESRTPESRARFEAWIAQQEATTASP